MQHPLRPRILRHLLEQRTTSAMELSRAWGIGVGFLAELAQLGAQTHERQLADPGRSEPVRLVVLLARERAG